MQDVLKLTEQESNHEFQNLQKNKFLVVIKLRPPRWKCGILATTLLQRYKIEV